MSRGISRWGAYIPRRRLDRSAIAAAHAWMAPSLKGLAKGARAYCNWDEDAITLAVEAARSCMSEHDRSTIDDLTFASTTSPFADLPASGIASAALSLKSSARTRDVSGSHRAGFAALTDALSRDIGQTMIVGSDRPRAKPASVQEMHYGAGAAAFLVDSKDVAVEQIGAATNSTLFVDHFRAATEAHDYYWEERWIRDEGYLKLGAKVVREALANANLTGERVAKFIFPAPANAPTVAAAIAKKVGIAATAIVDSLDRSCGYAGAAHPLLMLAQALDQAKPGEIIVLASFAQGCEAVVLRATDRIVSARPKTSVAALLDAGVVDDAYLRMASFYGEIAPDWGMRGERDAKTALTEQYRSVEQVYGFVAGRCPGCESVQFPQLAYCVTCQAPASDFAPLSLADERARVLTFTADALAFHPAPPLYVGFAQFDNGARLLMEFVDVDPASFDIGAPLEMRFRIKDQDRQRGYDRYFWKAAPVAPGGGEIGFGN